MNINKPIISSGKPEVDEKFGNFEPGQLYVLAGRPMMGKAALMINVTAAISEQAPSLYFCLDISKNRLEKKFNLAQIEVVDDLLLLSEKRFNKLLQLNTYAVVVIDYLQLLPTEMNKLSFFKEMAKEYNTCIVLVSQLDRTCELREDSKPTLDDVKRMFRDQEQLMQQTDGILGVYNTNRFTQEEKEKFNTVELIPLT